MTIFKGHTDLSKCDLIVIPVCWSLNRDFRFKSHIKPILDSSNEMELFHEFYGYQKGCKIGVDVDLNSENLDESVSRAIKETDWSNKDLAKSSIHLINEDYKKLTSFIEEKVDFWLAQEKLVVVLGGDATVNLGALKGFANLRKTFGVLHLGAKPFLLPYDGGVLNEVNSIHNIGLNIPEVSKIVGVGYKEISQKEYSVQKENKEKIIWFSNKKNKNYLLNGEAFVKVAKRWVNSLPEFIYLSIHASILEVLSLDEVEFALQLLEKSRRKIIGVDISGLDKKVEATEIKEITNLLYLVSKSYGRTRGKI